MGGVATSVSTTPTPTTTNGGTITGEAACNNIGNSNGYTANDAEFEVRCRVKSIRLTCVYCACCIVVGVVNVVVLVVMVLVVVVIGQQQS